LKVLPGLWRALEEPVLGLGGGVWSAGPGRSVKESMKMKKYEAAVMCALFFPFGFLYSLKATYLWCAWMMVVVMRLYLKSALAIDSPIRRVSFVFFGYIIFSDYFLSIPLGIYVSSAERTVSPDLGSLSSTYDSDVSITWVKSLPPTSHPRKSLINPKQCNVHTSALTFFQLRLTTVEYLERQK
jgi:hypothetical protein